MCDQIDKMSREKCKDDVHDEGLVLQALKGPHLALTVLAWVCLRGVACKPGNMYMQ